MPSALIITPHIAPSTHLASLRNSYGSTYIIRVITKESQLMLVRHSWKPSRDSVSVTSRVYTHWIWWQGECGGGEDLFPMTHEKIDKNSMGPFCHSCRVDINEAWKDRLRERHRLEERNIAKSEYPYTERLINIWYRKHSIGVLYRAREMDGWNQYLSPPESQLRRFLINKINNYLIIWISRRTGTSTPSTMIGRLLWRVSGISTHAKRSALWNGIK